MINTIKKTAIEVWQVEEKHSGRATWDYAAFRRWRIDLNNATKNLVSALQNLTDDQAKAIAPSLVQWVKQTYPEKSPHSIYICGLQIIHYSPVLADELARLIPHTYFLGQFAKQWHFVSQD